MITRKKKVPKWKKLSHVERVRLAIKRADKKAQQRKTLKGRADTFNRELIKQRKKLHLR
jgi:hypothetical protein